MKPRLFALILSSCLLSDDCRGAVIANDAILMPYGGPADYILSLNQSIPSGEGRFAVAITQINPVQFQFDYYGIAEEYALYLASPGSQLLPSFALTTTPFVTNTGAVGPGILTLSIGQSVLLGYWDDRTFEGVADFGDNYGWVELFRTPTGLVELGGYTAVGTGIIAGTSTTIPEPTSVLLASISFLVTCLRRCRKKTGEQDRAQEAPVALRVF